MEELKIGDIVIIENFISQNKPVNRHSFVVIDERSGKVCGIDYDFIALLMSSFKDDIQKEKKLKYPGNFPIASSKEDVASGHKKEGFIKAEQFYYFNKSKTKYTVIGQLKPETLDYLLQFIQEFPEKKVEIEQILDNL